MHVFLFSAGTAAAQFALSTVTVSAESVNDSVRVIWSPPECVTSAAVEFRTSTDGPVTGTYTTTNSSQTEVIQTGLQCGTYYYISVVVTVTISGGVQATLSSRQVQVSISGGKVSYCKCAWGINLMVIHYYMHRYTNSS